MKYNVGDKVRVRSDLIEDNMYFMENSDTYDSVVDVMMEYCGQEVEIKYTDDEKYLITGDDDEWHWTDEMFEGLIEDEGLDDFNMSDLNFLEEE